MCFVHGRSKKDWNRTEIACVPSLEININLVIIFEEQRENNKKPHDFPAPSLKVWAVAQFASLLFIYEMEIYSSGELFTKQ